MSKIPRQNTASTTPLRQVPQTIVDLARLVGEACTRRRERLDADLQLLLAVSRSRLADAREELAYAEDDETGLAHRWLLDGLEHADLAVKRDRTITARQLVRDLESGLQGAETQTGARGQQACEVAETLTATCCAIRDNRSKLVELFEKGAVLPAYGLTQLEAERASLRGKCGALLALRDDGITAAVEALELFADHLVAEVRVLYPITLREAA